MKKCSGIQRNAQQYVLGVTISAVITWSVAAGYCDRGMRHQAHTATRLIQRLVRSLFERVIASRKIHTMDKSFL